MADEVKLPKTEKFRVVIAGAAYDSPRIRHDEQGKGEVIYVRESAVRAEEIELVPREAKRLQDLGAVVPASEPRSYDEMDDAELAAETKARGLVVTSSSADPDQPLRQDFVAALQTFDAGQTAGVGVSTVPGGLAIGGVTAPFNEGDFAQEVGTPPEETAPADGGVASRLTSAQLAQHITDEKLNASDTVDLAGGDPALAAKVLEAEGIAQGGDPRATVEGPLQKTIDG